MKILQICNKPPFPPIDGGAIGMNNITQGLLNNGHVVKVLAINTTKHYVNLNELPESYREKTQIELVLLDTRVRFFRALKNLFSTKSYHVQRFESSALQLKIKEVLQQERYDIVQLESVFLASYISIIRKYSSAKIVLRAPNVEHVIWKRIASSTTNPLKRIYINILSNRLKKVENNIANKVDAIYTVTQEDLDYFRSKHSPVQADFIPTGVDCMKEMREEKEIEEEWPSVFHIGAMDWLPNIEGLEWFIKHVWLHVIQQFPTVMLYLAGRNMSKEWCSCALPNVVNLGEIEDAYSFIKSKAIMIVPLFSGSGMRVKIIEGMTLGKTIIATSIAAEGIQCEDDKNIMIANTAEEFIQAISRCIVDREYYKNIGVNARQNIDRYYNNDMLTKKLETFFEKILNTP